MTAQTVAECSPPVHFAGHPPLGANPALSGLKLALFLSGRETDPLTE